MGRWESLPLRTLESRLQEDEIAEKDSIKVSVSGIHKGWLNLNVYFCQALSLSLLSFFERELTL